MAINRDRGAPEGLNSGGFPEPFFDYASAVMPKTIRDALDWAQRIVLSNGVYMSALNRLASYFITDIEFSGLSGKRISREEVERLTDIMNGHLRIKTNMQTTLLNLLIYGNDFSAVIFPINRYLYCPQCAKSKTHDYFEIPFERVYSEEQFGFKWDWQFLATCPACKYRGPWKHVDRRSPDTARINIKHYPPQEIDIKYDEHSGERKYVWKIPETYARKLRPGSDEMDALGSAPMELISAVKEKKWLLFDDEHICHTFIEPPSGLDLQGWGLSPVVANFREAYNWQILRRFNEGTALEHVIPFRVLTPPPRGGEKGATDPITTMSMSGFVRNVTSMLRRRRRDPGAWFVLPTPIQYNAIGGEAANMVPVELLNNATDMLLTAIGIPVEMFKGTMSMQAAPAALRLLEAQFAYLPQSGNKALDFITNRIAKVYSWEPVIAKMQRVTHADDLNRQMAKLQMMQMQQISRTDGLRSIGMDFEDQQRRMIEEEKFIAEETARAQKEMEQTQLLDSMAPTPFAQMAQQMAPQQGGDPAAGGQQGAQPGAPAPAIQGPIPSPNAPISLDEMTQLAQSKAEQLMALPSPTRRSELTALKRQNPTLHMLVTSIIDQNRQSAASQGQQMVLQQQYGQPG